MIKLQEREQVRKKAPTISRNGIGNDLVKELLTIEDELQESLSWLHVGACTCEQCLYELHRQRKLLEARQRVMSEIANLRGLVSIYLFDHTADGSLK